MAGKKKKSKNGLRPASPEKVNSEEDSRKIVIPEGNAENDPQDDLINAPPLSYEKPSKSTNKQPTERKASGFYSQLSQDQITMLRDVFSLMDDDNDGIILDEDLVKTFKMVNKEILKEERDAMFALVQSPLAFGGFLSSMAENLGDLSTKDELHAAFEVFSEGEKDEMKCNMDLLKEYLINAGMDNQEIDGVLRSFVKTGADGKDYLLAGRFVDSIIES